MAILKALDPATNAFAQALQRNRQRCNTLFRMQRHQHPHLDGKVLNQWLLDVIEPVVRELVDQGVDANELSLAFFELSLELAVHRQLGTQRDDSMRRLWTRLIPRWGQRLKSDAAAQVGKLINASLFMRQFGNSAVDLWLDLMEQATVLEMNAVDLFEFGQVNSWRCGAAQFRQSALDLCQSMRADSLVLLFGDRVDWTVANAKKEALTRMNSDPWWNANKLAEDRSLKLVNRIDGYRGFGGHFQAPPIVQLQGTDFAISDGHRWWRLYADCYGHNLQRFDYKNEDFEPLEIRPPWKCKLDGSPIECDSEELIPPDWKSARSVAANPTTLVYTTPFSHQLMLVAKS